jgi:hypothetical protein
LPFGPPKVWITPTDGLPGSPTIAILKVTTPAFSPDSDEPNEVPDELVDGDADGFAPDELLPEHPAATADSAAITPTTATRECLMQGLPASVR